MWILPSRRWSLVDKSKIDLAEAGTGFFLALALARRPFFARAASRLRPMKPYQHLTASAWAMLLLTSFSTLSIAQSPADDQKRAARAAAEAGYEAMIAEDYEAALKFLARAESDFHAPTHVLMMAEAYDKLGKIVEAREALLSVVNERVGENASDAFLDAQKEASEQLAVLDPRVPRVTITVNVTRGGEPISAAATEVYLNDVRVPTSAFDAPYPINPGKYQARIRLDDTDGDVVEFAVDEGQVTAIELSIDAPALATTDAVSSSSERRGTPAMAYVGWGVGGLGIVAGTITGAIAMSKVSSLKKDHCQGTECDPAYQDDFNRAETLGWVSTASFAVGAAGVAVGLYYMLAGSSDDASQDSALLHDSALLNPKVDVTIARDWAYTQATWSF